MREHLRRWGACWILAALFLGSWLGQLLVQLAVVRDDAAEHNRQLEWAAFWHQYLASTFENWQSEFLQLVVQGILLLALSKHLFRADNTASKEDVEAVREDIRQLRMRIRPARPVRDEESP